jgi:hypothetical protein
MMEMAASSEIMTDAAGWQSKFWEAQTTGISEK